MTYTTAWLIALTVGLILCLFRIGQQFIAMKALAEHLAACDICIRQLADLQEKSVGMIKQFIKTAPLVEQVNDLMRSEIEKARNSKIN